MFEKVMEKLLPIPIDILELIGIFVIIVGAIKTFYHYIMQLLKKEKYSIKSKFANAMATGLEFKLASEILKTILIRNINQVIILGAITLLRGFMTFIINFELKTEQQEKNYKKKIQNEPFQIEGSFKLFESSSLQNKDSTEKTDLK